MSLLLKPKGSKYEVAEDYAFRDVIVPKGYLTDGVSYKFRLLGIFINKFDPLYIEAAVVHDYLTDKGEWKKANSYFEDLLPNTTTAKVMVVAVDWYWKLGRVMLGFS